ncbi:D-arabinose 5-phosphate isomerase [bacterium SM23_31]|nr:MAG: D-arabinose 5-phosphate isomerase [bacterium SM23_31]
MEAGKRVLQIEADAISSLIDKIGDQFETAVDLIYNCKGRVVVSGVGKSGVIGKKISATLCSTGTPAVFLHATDGLHGDLGVVKSKDVIIWISKSGNSEEFNGSIPLLKRIGLPIIAMTGNMNSQLVKKSDVVLDVTVKEEACPNDLAPTASTTATLALGDALAIAVLNKRNLSREDFAYLHPGGSLGKQLLLKIDDLMYTGKYIPVVEESASFRESILEMNTKRFGSTCVVDGSGKLTGIITDGDLKRLLEKWDNLDKLTAKQAMSPNPKTISVGSLAAKAMHIMKSYNIMQIIVVDNENYPVGMVHLHDLLNEGLS